MKPKIAVFNKYYLPGYKAGGPIRTLANMVDHLGDDFDFYIVTLDRDAGDNESYPDIHHGEWNNVGNARVMYLRPETVSISTLVEIVSDLSPDAIYLNSFFDATFTQRILLARRLKKIKNIPVVLAPRGEFSQGALGINRFKKRAYLRLSSILGLYRDLIWQASSSLENQDIRRNLSFVQSSEVKEALDLAPKVSLQNIDLNTRQSDSPLRVCFLSRISPMKNLDFALKVLGEVSSSITFTIYGPKELASYWERCETLIEDLPDNVNVVYAGEVHPSNVNAELSKHDLFFFPTRGENYGHVIHEALLAGLPVLISDQTPWRDLEEHGVGWSYPLSDMPSFSSKIDEVAEISSEEQIAKRKKAVDFALQRSSDDKALSDNIALFKFAALRAGL